MTKAELIDALSAKKDLPDISKKAYGDIVDTVFHLMARSIKREKRFHYPNFGTFELRKRKGRTGRNPRTGEEIQIKSTKTVGFKPAKSFKATLR